MCTHRHIHSSEIETPFTGETPLGVLATTDKKVLELAGIANHLICLSPRKEEQNNLLGALLVL